VTAGTDLTGGGTTGNVTLNLDTTKVPQLNAANTFTGNQDINGGLTVNGNVFVFSDFGVSSLGDSVGVYGQAQGSGETFGVEGFSFSTNGVGVLGMGESSSNTGLNFGGCCPFGVWGDTGSNALGAAALIGTADEGRAIFLQNNSSIYPTAFMFQALSGNLALQAGGAAGYCTVDTNGDLACQGSKSAVVPVDNGTRQVALYAVEAPQNWFEDFGSGHLANGVAAVALEPTFAQTVDTESDYHVFLTPEGDCQGLYVSQKTAAGFEVRELGGGNSSVAFAYRIVALRRGYAGVRLADKTDMMKKLKASMPNSVAKPQRKRPAATAHLSTPDRRAGAPAE
jgi:hypothetical protein